METSKHQSGTAIPQDLPCVWMTAGVLNYMLCDRDYECDHCALDQVLRKQEASSPTARGKESASSGAAGAPSRCTGAVEAQVEQCFSRIVAGSKIYLDRCYSASHFWMYPQQDTVVVGMDTNMLRLLHPVTRVVPPEKDVYFRQNQYCGLLVRDELAIPLHSPFSGTVVEVNQEYVRQLRRTYPPVRDEWMFRLEPEKNTSSMGDLCQGESLLRWYLQKMQVIRQHLREMISRTAIGELGMTMADGGEAELNLEAVLGRESYRLLIREIFGV